MQQAARPAASKHRKRKAHTLPTQPQVVSTAVAGVWMVATAAPAAVVIDTAVVGQTFDGIGGLSAGGSTPRGRADIRSSLIHLRCLRSEPSVLSPFGQISDMCRSRHGGRPASGMVGAHRTNLNLLRSAISQVDSRGGASMVLDIHLSDGTTDLSTRKSH